MKVLIVEDEPTAAKLLEHSMRRYADCERASNGEEAFNKFCDALENGKPFDLVFLDIVMPGVDGQEALAAIREAEEGFGVPPEAGVKVIMTSAMDDSQNLYQAHVAGCNEYLIKPISPADLFKALKKVGALHEDDYFE